MAIDGNLQLYRIIGLEAFLSILINKSERYVRPIDYWQDTFEGYMLHQLDSSIGRNKVLTRLYILSGKDANITIRNLSKLLRSRYACYAQCWSKESDSDAMWRIYSYENKSIQIMSTVQKIHNHLDSSSWTGLEKEIDEVKYDIINEDDAIKKILVRNAKIDTAFFHKRPAFKHESEVRVLLNDLHKYSNVDAFASTAIRANMNLEKNKNNNDVPAQINDALSHLIVNGGYLSIAPPEVQLPIHNIREYIEGVRVHPQAPDWYVELVRKICKNYKIRFFGKSDLYRPTI